MAEDQRPPEEMKKDTVRINLPPGLTGRGAPPYHSSDSRARTTTSFRSSGVSRRRGQEGNRRHGPSRGSAQAQEGHLARPGHRRQAGGTGITASHREVATGSRPRSRSCRGTRCCRRRRCRSGNRQCFVVSADGGGGALSLVAIVLSLAVAGYLAYMAFS